MSTSQSKSASPCDAAAIEAAVTSPNFSHARQGNGCWRDIVWLYHRDPESPSGCKLAAAGPSAIVDPILERARRASALSPTEGR